MVSISSSRLIRERTRKFCSNIKNWSDIENNVKLFKEINNNLEKEYNIIPEKERLGKGIVYISRYISKEIFQYLIKEIKVDDKYLMSFIQGIFNYGETKNNNNLQHFALLFLSEYVANSQENFEKIIPLIKKYASHENWSIRESATLSIVSGLKKESDKILNFLLRWVKSKNENLRRIVAESLRPRAEIKWLRDSSKNDKVLAILTMLNNDPSIYVRKSVGNNIKDLSKYMPEKMLKLMDQWINESKIKVHNNLATEIGLNKYEKRLVWTMKQGMRWIKDRDPEYHSRLEKILGRNYVLYFDEKRNRLAKPIRK